MDVTQYNAAHYDHYWQYARGLAPEDGLWWPMVERLCAGTTHRLEIGPGAWPRLPVQGTHAVDLSQHALRLLAAKGAVTHHGTLETVQFSDASFQVVGMFEVLEHVEDDSRLLAEIARILRKGGRLILSVPLGMRYFSAWDRFAGHVRRFEPEELSGKLADAGFRIDEFEVRSHALGPFAATIAVALSQAFPRTTLRLMERLLVAAARRTRLTWHDGAEWTRLSAGARECTVVCTRL